LKEYTTSKKDVPQGIFKRPDPKYIIPDPDEVKDEEEVKPKPEEEKKEEPKKQDEKPKEEP
jgi:hypothetical protein